MGKLTVKGIDNLKKTGFYTDGDGLCLSVKKSGSKSWVHRYQLNGRRRDMGLGSYPEISLRQARDMVEDNRRLLEQGVDPLSATEEQSKVLTFDDCAREVIETKRPEWKNPKSEAQWTSSLKMYASPVIGKLPVEDVSLEHILKILKPIWVTKTETATRVRNRIEIILNWAKVMKYRQGENPAAWRGNLDSLLAKPSKVSVPKSHNALPYSQMSEFMLDLKSRDSLSSLCLQFTILTAARTSEALAASWDEIDGNVWTIPAKRMKAAKGHKVPLSAQTMKILEQLPFKEGWLFPSNHHGKHLSNMAMLVLLQRYMGRPDLTVHGFRSTFRDWTAEETHTANIVAEMALAHIIKDGAEAAYRRGDLLKKRAKLMQSWADYCDLKPSAKVRSIRRKV